jgi:anti-anti-sigma regulatory factor
LKEGQLEINVSRVEARVPVTVLEPHGELDGSNYRELIAQGQAAAKAGARYVLIDLGDVPYISSAGLVALHTIANLLRGAAPPDANAGWQALHSISQESSSEGQDCLKLCALQPDVERVLSMAGLTRFYKAYADRVEALAAF